MGLSAGSLASDERSKINKNDSLWSWMSAGSAKDSEVKFRMLQLLCVGVVLRGFLSPHWAEDEELALGNAPL